MPALETLWNLFTLTGQIDLYLLYKQLQEEEQNLGRLAEGRDEENLKGQGV